MVSGECCCCRVLLLLSAAAADLLNDRVRQADIRNDHVGNRDALRLELIIE